MTTLDYILLSILVAGPFVGSVVVWILHAVHLDKAADVVAAKLPTLFHTVAVLRPGLSRVTAAEPSARSTVILEELARLGSTIDHPEVTRLAVMASAELGKGAAS